MTAVDATAILALLPGRPRLLALGEPAHGQGSLLRVRNDLFRHLVEREGYRTITIESDCLRGRLVDDYVTGGRESPAGGFSHGWGEFDQNRDLVRWMRAFNEGRPAEDQVRFAGFDGPLEISAAPSPREALTALHAYLAARVGPGLLPGTAATLDRLLGPDGRWSEPAAMRDPARSVGRTAEAKDLRLFTDDLLALLDSESPHLLATSTPDEVFQARLSGRTAAGLLRYHGWMADPAPHRIERLCATRDAMMAANLLALAERGPTLVSAHNSHLQRTKSSMWMGGPIAWWSAGAVAAAVLGARYAFLATAVGTIHRHGVGTPPPDTIEGHLYDKPALVVDPGSLAAVPLVPRVSPWYGYAPLDPAQLADVDGIVFVKDVR